MHKKILFNNTEYNPSVGDLPFLIHGREHEGASLFTVTLVANLYEQGLKLLFLSGYPMAREELLTQVGSVEDAVLASGNKPVDKLGNAKIIFVQRENTSLFIGLANSLPDINERVIIIKNINLFDEEVCIPVKDHARLVLSGDLDNCNFKSLIQGKQFESTVLFSKPVTKLGINLPNLDKYEGYLFSKKGTNGIISTAS